MIKSYVDFKQGMSITCKIGGTLIKDAKLTKEGSTWFVVQDVKCGTSPRNTLGYRYGWTLSTGWTEGGQQTKDIKPVSGIFALSVGDGFKFDGSDCTIEAISGNAIAYSRHTSVSAPLIWRTYDNLISKGAEFPKEGNDVPEYTMTEAVKLLGHEFKIKE